MGLKVIKFGGTSVGSTDKIKNVAARCIEYKEAGHQVVVVLSAMSGETNRLVRLAEDMTDDLRGKDFDLIVSSGEQVTIGLLSMFLNSSGNKARAFLGSQVSIITDSQYSSARIKDIETDELSKELKNGVICVVAGFQGVDSDGFVTTLGRGGSDTTAVALAAALKADICEIFTDVDGIYTTDPGICKDARKIHKISYEEMLEMASLGAKVLQTRSVEFAKKYSVPLMVRSSFSSDEGTLVCMEDESMEKVMVSGVTYNKNEAKISVIRVPDTPGIAAKLFKPLTEAGVNVDMIVQNIGHDSHTDMTFTVLKSDYSRALKITKEIADSVQAQKVDSDENIAKISIVGAGMRSHAGVASKMFEVLSDNNINMQMISTSEIKISCVIDEAQTDEAVNVLHKAFELDKTDVTEE